MFQDDVSAVNAKQCTLAQSWLNGSKQHWEERKKVGWGDAATDAVTRVVDLDRGKAFKWKIENETRQRLCFEMLISTDAVFAQAPVE